MGVELSFPTKIPVRQSPRTDGQSAGRRPPRDCTPPHQKGREDSKTAQTGTVTLIQRFGRSGAPGALNLNPAWSTSRCCSLMGFMQKANTVRMGVPTGMLQSANNAMENTR
jgi:hypothetical protein